MRLPRVRFTMRRLMAFVAVVCLLLWAWRYGRDNASIDRSLTTIQLRDFAGGDPVQRRMAIEDLAHSGPDDRARVLTALAAGSVDSDWQVRLAAARSLGLVCRGWVRGSVAKEDVDLIMRALVGALDDQRAEVRIEAMQAMVSLYINHIPQIQLPGGHQPVGSTFAALEQRAADLLLQRMSDSDPASRSAAVHAFSWVGSASGAGPDPVVRMMVSDPVKEVRIAASFSLPQGMLSRELYSHLLRRLKQVHSIEERSAIGWAIGGNLPAPPVEAIPDLIEALALDHFALNKTVPMALAKLGPAGRPALPALAKAANRELADPKDFSAMDAALAIVTIDSNSPEAQALLHPMVALLRGSPSDFMRQQAAMALEKYGRSAVPAVQALRDALRTGTPEVRQRAAYLLGTIGPAARPALEELDAMARQSVDPRLRRFAVEATWRIEAE
jgi:HEAT repeat protein